MLPENAHTGSHNPDDAPGAHFFPLGLLFCLLLGVVSVSGLLSGGELAGHAGGEAFGHAWSHWWRGQALPGWPGGTELVLGAGSWPLIDPLPSFFSGLVGLLAGPAAGYNAWLALSVVLAGAGGWFLAARTGGSPWVGAVALAWAPPFLGSLGSGLTEDSGLGLSALGLAFLGEPFRKGGWLSGACIGLSACCGLVLGWLTGLCALLLGAVLLLGRPGRWRSLAASAAVAAPLAGLAAWPHLSRLEGAGHRSGELHRLAEPLWRVNPWKNADLASLATPGRAELADSLVRTHPGYLGILLLLLALLSPARRWWLPLSAMAALSLGPSIWWAGEPSGVSNPVYPLLALLPGAELLNHHGRALLLASVALAALASSGAARLPWPGLAALLAAADLAFLSPLSPRLPTTGPTESPVLLSLAARDLDGYVLPLPAAGPGIAYQKPLWEQRLHGQRLWLHPNRPGVPGAGSDPVLKWLSGLAFPDPAPPPREPVFPPGLSALLVREPYSAPVAEALGPPDDSDGIFSLWRLPRPALGSPPNSVP